MIYIDFPRGESATIPQIALQGEYGAHAVRWDLTQEAFYTQWPSGHGTVWFAKADSTPWPLDAVQTGDMIEAELGPTETAETGMVKVCLVWAKGDTVLAKTRWYWLEIGESAYGGSEPGEPASDWLAAIASIQEAAETAAEAAADSESNAAGSAEEADAAALDAEAWAVGTRDGAAVDEEDAAYHNNAKYYAQQADQDAQTATEAAGAATGAKDIALESATLAAAAAANAAASADAAGTDAGKAKQHMEDAAAEREAAEDAAQDAAIFAETAEAWAKGTNSGVPVSSGSDGYQDNAKYYAEQARDAAEDAIQADMDAVAAAATATAMQGAAQGNAEDAEAWAVGTRDGEDVDEEDPAYHNNAKYYAEQVASNTEAAEQAAERAEAASAATPIIQGGTWWIWNTEQESYVDTGISATGPKGDAGSDGSEGPQGLPGEKGETGEAGMGIVSIEKTGDEGLVDYYTVLYTDGTSDEIEVHNGEKGEKGDKGDPGEDGKDLTEEFEALTEYVEELSPVQTTKAAAVASVDDAAPLKAEEIVVGIEPVQDLHGYDNPWPAGGGKNKLASNATKDVTIVGAQTIVVSLTKNVAEITIDRDMTASIGYRFNDGSIETVLPAGEYFFSTDITNQQAGSGLFIFDATTATILGRARAEEGARISLSAETTVRLGLSLSAGTKAGTYWFQLESGSTATSFAPYSNICPITGWTAAQMTRTGKNLFDEANATRYARYFKVASNNVHVWASEQNSGSFALPCKPNETYTVSCDNSSITIFRVGYIDVDPNELDSSSSPSIYGVVKKSESGAITITTGANAKAIVVQYNNVRVTAKDTLTQIELGSTATAYEPYHGSTTPISWADEAGTVYGGYVDLVNGKLVVDRAMFDLGSLNWNYVSNSSFNLRSSTSINAVLPDNAYGVPDAISSVYTVLSYVNTADTDKSLAIIFATGSAPGRVWVHDTSYTDADTFKIAMSGVQLVYKLATPITYDIDPVTLTLLRGSNNLWADTGDTTLTYRQDVAILLKKLTSQVAALTAAVANA